MFGGKPFPAKKYYLSLFTGVDFPFYSRHFVDRVKPSVLIGGELGYNFSSRFSIKISFDYCNFILKEPDEDTQRTSSTRYNLLTILKFNLRPISESKISTYLLFGFGTNYGHAYSITIMVGQPKKIVRYSTRDLIICPGVGFQYKFKNKWIAFLEVCYYLIFDYYDFSESLKHVYPSGDIPVKLGLAYYFKF